MMFFSGKRPHWRTAHTALPCLESAMHIIYSALSEKKKYYHKEIWVKICKDTDCM